MKNKVIGGMFLVSGTCIGTGILALPTTTAMAGFGYATLIFGLCWLFMTLGALYIMEADLWLSGETDLISMADNLLGKSGKIITWIAYLLLLYALISTYMLAGASWFVEIVREVFNLTLPTKPSIVLFSAVFGSIVYLGTNAVDNTNRLMMCGLIIVYFVIIATALPHVQFEQISFGDASTLPQTIPLIITTFGFAIVVPTLTTYMDRKAQPVLLAILLGSIISLILYVLWDFIILGNIPVTGEQGLLSLVENKDPGTGVVLTLTNLLQSPWINYSAKLFAIFAVITSFLGVSISLVHFLADGFNVSTKGKSGLLLILLAYIPPFLILIFYPAGFGQILSLAGLFVAILLGILPAIMVWVGRYRRNLSEPGGYRTIGGKLFLIATIMFFSYVVLQQIYNVI